MAFFFFFSKFSIDYFMLSKPINFRFYAIALYSLNEEAKK